jgi:type I restriction enzyme S subunit
MTDLPSGWRLVTIGDVMEVNPRKPTKSPTSPNLEVSFVPMSAVSAEDGRIDTSIRKTIGDLDGKSYRYFEEGDLLVAKITPSMENGKAAVALGLINGVGFGSTEFHVLRPGPDVTAHFVLWYVLQRSFRADAARHMTGTAGQLRVPADYLRSRTIPLPPLDEQLRIVEMTEDTLGRLGGVDADLVLCQARIRQLALRAVNDLLGRHEVATVQLFDAVDVFEDCPHRTPTYSDDGPYPALRPRDVVHGQLNLATAARVSRKEYDRQSARHVLQPGDVVYSRELSYGWAAAIPEGSQVCLSQGMLALRPGAGITGDFLALVLNSTAGRRQSRLAAAGSAHPHVNLRDIRKFQIPLPDRSTQHEILSTVGMVSERLEHTSLALESARRRAARLRSSVLSAAFSGRLNPEAIRV